MEGGSTTDCQGENRHREIFLLGKSARECKPAGSTQKVASQKTNVSKPGAALQPEQRLMHPPEALSISHRQASCLSGGCAPIPLTKHLAGWDVAMCAWSSCHAGRTHVPGSSGPVSRGSQHHCLRAAPPSDHRCCESLHGATVRVVVTFLFDVLIRGRIKEIWGQTPTRCLRSTF